MRTTEVVFGGQPPIDAYGAGGFRVEGAFREGALLMLPSGPAPWAVEGRPGPSDFAAAIAEAGAVDVLLVGMGREIAPLDRAARAALEAAGIGVEVMSTGSACRTYNVLLSEGRRVAAALIAV